MGDSRLVSKTVHACEGEGADEVGEFTNGGLAFGILRRREGGRCWKGEDENAEEGAGGALN